MENVNLANLPGILTYLQEEVVGECSRQHCGKMKFGITRVGRYRITMYSTQEAYHAYDVNHVLPPGAGHQFARFTAFDFGRIAWEPKGLPSVGCASKEIYDGARRS